MRKKLMILGLVSLILCNTCIGVMAKEKKRDIGSEDYKTFSQLDERWRNYKIGSSGYTVGSAGCLITSISILMAYANPSLRDVKDWNPGIASKKLTFDGWGSLVTESVSNVDSTFSKYKDDDRNYTPEEALQVVKNYYDQGYYIVIQCTNPPIAASEFSSHYSPVVGFENGKPVVWDVSGGLNSDWDTWAETGIRQIDVFKSSLSKSYQTMSGNNNVASNRPSSEKERQEIMQLVKEYELVGMPKDFKFEAEVSLPEYDSLSRVEKENLAIIKDSINSKKFSLFDRLRQCVSFIGLVTILYGVLLGVAYIFDKVNMVVEISLLSILTWGKYRVWEEDLGIKPGRVREKGIMYCDNRIILTRIAIIECVGFFLISGALYKIIYYIMNNIL